MVWKTVPKTMMPLGYLTERLLMPAALGHSRVILVPSRATAQDIARHYPESRDKIVHTPLAGTLHQPQRPLVKRDKPYVLFVGTLEPRKNLERTLDAFLKLDPKFAAGYQLVIAGGKGWKTSAVLRRLTGPGSPCQVDYLGQVSDDVLAELYAGSEFLVAPSLYEGFGLQVLEAMHFGKPVITSNVSSLPEVAGGAGLLVDPTSVSEIAGAMQELMCNEPLYRRLSAAATEESRQYSWDRTARLTLQALERAVA
jgi:glycosyltransferase involved in cell wall biosynthesis